MDLLIVLKVLVCKFFSLFAFFAVSPLEGNIGEAYSLIISVLFITLISSYHFSGMNSSFQWNDHLISME